MGTFIIFFSMTCRNFFHLSRIFQRIIKQISRRHGIVNIGLIFNSKHQISCFFIFHRCNIL